MSWRWLPYALLCALAALWLTWPAAPLAGLGVAALVAVGALVATGRRQAALVALAAAAFATTLLPGGIFDWRPWTSGVLFALLLAAVLGGSSPRPRPGMLALAGALVPALAFLRAWRPTKDLLASESGAILGVALLATLGVALVIVLTTGRGEEDDAVALPDEPAAPE